MKNKYDMKTDSMRHDDAAKMFFENYKELLNIKTHFTGKRKKYDYIDSDGKGITLRADDKAQKTGNLFVERWSSKDKKGGPWQAIEKGSVYYIFYLPGKNEFFMFNTEELIKFVEKNKNKYKLRRIQNTVWAGSGYAIPIRVLEDIRLDVGRKDPASHFF